MVGGETGNVEVAVERLSIFMQRSGLDEEYTDDDGLGLPSHKGVAGEQRMDRSYSIGASSPTRPRRRWEI